MDELPQVWAEWERWFTQIEETHTSLSAVVFFRSQRPNRSWITAAGAVLDAAALARAAVDIPPDPQADLMIRAGYLALRYIAAAVRLQAQPRSAATRRTRSACRARNSMRRIEHLLTSGVPMRQDRDQAWLDFAGWRVNYDAPLIGLCALVMAPYAPWSADRADGHWYLTPKFKNANIAAGRGHAVSRAQGGRVAEYRGSAARTGRGAATLPLNAAVAPTGSAAAAQAARERWARLAHQHPITAADGSTAPCGSLTAPLRARRLPVPAAAVARARCPCRPPAGTA